LYLINLRMGITLFTAQSVQFILTNSIMNSIYNQKRGIVRVCFTLTAIYSLVSYDVQAAPANPFIKTRQVDVKQQSPIVGTVLDEKGMPLPGVSIRGKGGQGGGSTDAQGKFSIQLPNTETTLVISYVGYLTHEVNIVRNQAMRITLQPDAQALNEVVVVGYGTQKRATVTGSISEVKGADMVKSPQPNVSNSLAGRFSGLVATNRGGEPGYDGSQIRIRGISTTGNTDVLVVVDGVPGQVGGLERLDPNDIESVSVLKDASAAVYGSRAANGVILVTTKKGAVANQPFPIVSTRDLPLLPAYQRWPMPLLMPPFVTRSTIITIRREASFNSIRQKTSKSLEMALILKISPILIGKKKYWTTPPYKTSITCL
jgi:TonB-dependent SusC/RagA subfamily outer membrane receptor